MNILSVMSFAFVALLMLVAVNSEAGCTRDRETRGVGGGREVLMKAGVGKLFWCR